MYINGTTSISCSHTEVFCDALSPIENGFLATVSDSYNVGSVASYGCEAGYNLVGALNRTCTASNTTTFWSEAEPTCQSKLGQLQHYSLIPLELYAIYSC